MDTLTSIWNFITANWQYAVAIILIVLAFLAGLNKQVGGIVKKVWGVITMIILFFAGIIREGDGNGGTTGKASFTRMAGIYIILNIVAMSWTILWNGKGEIPTAMMILFWLTSGGLMFIKIYQTAGDHLQGLIDGIAAKWSNGLILPKGTPPAPATAPIPAAGPKTEISVS